MESLVDTFFQIDKNHTFEISADDLRRYAEENEYDDEMPQKWLQLFDTDHTGKITLQKYCDVLGIVFDSQQICQYRVEERQLALPEKVSAPYEVLYTEMPEAMQIEIVDMAREMMDENVAFRELPT
ncbi:hypothetical protein AHF37_08813 [Paragonimus kellicotti]|nr:hypothetical protein AHF37_08813 [Paragonimus kellicotti]